ncbi:protein precursor [Diplodia corticola]|uniref:Protein n=1 Tax=Diplodia corticola TaxID=236234 RepID=A0A1J9REN1_9PEZI|nr:protein precursor [Diplodia corticola]OJD39000.1 protein precursor [Diplodia corticola]
MFVDNYLAYSIALSIFVIATALYFTRARWSSHLPHLPFSRWLYSRLPGGHGSFEDDMEAGFSSAHFDLAGNVAGGDARAGLDGAAKAEVRRIMRARGCGFDEARRVYMQDRFSKNNIGPDGLPRDPKFVSFS